MASQQQEVLLKNAEPGRQEPQPPSNRPRSTFADVWRKWWGLELTSLLLGVASIVGLIAILRNRDDKTAPRNGVVAGVNITLNTVVAILATIGKATLLLAVSECISQLKWTWYMNKRLEDLDVFDGASRGAWGGLELLWKINIRQIASLGALLVVVGLPVTPLSQQLVQYDVRNQNISGQPDTASLLTAISWDESDTDDGVASVPYRLTQGGQPLETPSPPLLMKAAILRGLYAGTTTIDHIRPTCPGGNCTYPHYRSLAICARSEDVSSQLNHKKAYADDSPEITPENFNVLQWSLTDSNYLIDDGMNRFNLSSAAKKNPTKYYEYGTPTPMDFSQSIAFKDSSAPVADVFMIYLASKDKNNEIRALEFLLEWCVQNYSTTVTNGTATTERHEAVSLKDGDYPDFTLGPGTLELYQNYFREIFQGKAWRDVRDPTRLYVSNDATQVLFQPVNIFGVTANDVSITPNQGGGMDQLRKILDNIAVAMTNVIRTNYKNASTTTESKDNTNPLIIGSTWVQETYVRVQWGWIAAPIGLLVGSVLFVLGVIISSLSCDRRQRPGVWKSSNLPLLKALDGDLYHEGPSGMKSPRSMKEWAKEVPVRLTREADGDGWKLMRHWGGGEKSANQDDNN
ncbi:MAG: hypothetical protein LQ339_004497 [Xanthoria mediterranea]|nr:MAG: hypothetical protein LQ339_004497 [Xanthoria mediterranea]